MVTRTAAARAAPAREHPVLQPSIVAPPLPSAQELLVRQPPARLGKPVLLTLTLDGSTVDVAAVPLVTGADIMQAGNAMSCLAYNCMNGILSADIRDTSGLAWKGIPNPTKTAFRRIRDFLDTGKVGKTQLVAGAANRDTPSRAAWLREQWEAQVAEKRKAQEEAHAAGERANVRVRELALSSIAQLLKVPGTAPVARSGVNAIRDTIRGYIKRLRKAITQNKMSAVRKAVDALEEEIMPQEPAEKSE